MLNTCEGESWLYSLLSIDFVILSVHPCHKGGNTPWLCLNGLIDSAFFYFFFGWIPLDSELA